MASPAVDFFIGKDDILPALVLSPKTAANSVIVPSGTISVTITNVDTGAVISPAGTAEYFTDTDNIVKFRYRWAAADTANKGRFHLVVRDLFGGTDRESFPNYDKVLFEVFDQLPGQILKDRAEYQGVRDYLGVNKKNLPDGAIESTGFLLNAESFILKVLAAQTGVPTLVQIMAATSPASAADKIFLKAAVIYRIAYHFAVGETNAVNTSITVGTVTKDLGGVGAQWVNQREEALKDCDQALGSITGFKRWRTL